MASGGEEDLFFPSLIASARSSWPPTGGTRGDTMRPPQALSPQGLDISAGPPLTLMQSPAGTQLAGVVYIAHTPTVRSPSSPGVAAAAKYAILKTLEAGPGRSYTRVLRCLR